MKNQMSEEGLMADFERKLIAELEVEELDDKPVIETQAEIDNFVKDMCEELEEGIFINKEIKLNDR